MNEELKSVELKHNGATGTLVVDGLDITTSVAGVQLEVSSGPPTVIVRLSRRKPLDVEIQARVFSDSSEHDVEVLLAFLQDVDPQWLEEVMLAAPDMGTGMGEAAVSALIARARKEHDAA